MDAAKSSAPLIKAKSEKPGRPFVVRVVLPDESDKLKEESKSIALRVAYSAIPPLDARPKSKRKEDA